MIRKPRKFFGAYKEVYGDHIEKVGHTKPHGAATQTASAAVSWERHPYKPFDEYRGYRIIKGAVSLTPLVLLAGAVVYGLLLMFM